MNAVHHAGQVNDDGCKITWTEQGKPQTSFTLSVESVLVPLFPVREERDA
jgi:hypothetical protein